jgi:hypothetical protein
MRSVMPLPNWPAGQATQSPSSPAAASVPLVSAASTCAPSAEVLGSANVPTGQNFHHGTCV